MQNAQMAQAIIWDFEGTLAVRPGRFASALIAAAQDVAGVTLPLKTIRPLLSPGFPWHGAELTHSFAGDDDAWWRNLLDLSELVLQRFGLSPAVAAEASRRSRSIYLDIFSWQRIEGATELLDTLASRGWTNVIMSNFAPELDTVVAGLGFDRWVAMMFSSGRVGFEKPHPEYFRFVQRSLGDIHPVWMIGDTVTADIVGGNAAGLRTILIGSVAAEADHCVTTLSEISGIVGHPVRTA
jgi:putative hydrolase of the HAD superfamily